MPKTTLAVKGQVKDHIQYRAPFLPVVAAFLQSLHPTTSALQTSLQVDLETAPVLLGDRTPTPFTAPISTESFISYSSTIGSNQEGGTCFSAHFYTQA